MVAVFLEFKALYLFSLTFGIGVAVQAERAKLRDIHVEAFLVRRFLVLLAFGACHMLLVSKVDILALYAVCGLMVRWLRRYRFGPFEWLWRSMTYGRRQTHARSRAVAGATERSEIRYHTPDEAQSIFLHGDPARNRAHAIRSRGPQVFRLCRHVHRRE